MNRWAGYRIEFDEFKTYYKESSRTDNSMYLDKFITAFRAEMEKAGFPDGLYSDTVNRTSARLSGLCSKTRVLLVSKGVPSASATQIINMFKKWFALRWR